MPTKVFVGNLPDETPQETIRDVFGPYGGIDDIAIVKNFAFVHFTNEGDANNAVRDLDGSKIGGKQVNVEISKKQDNNNRDRGRRDDRRSDGGRSDRDHRDNRERHDRRGPPRGFRGGPDRGNNAGGILGAGPMGGGPPDGGPLGGPLRGPPLGGLGGPQLGGLGQQLGVLGGLNIGGLGAGALQGLGAGLGALSAAGGAPLGGAGILSAVNTLAAVAEKQQQLNSGKQQSPQQPPPDRRGGERDQPDPDVRVRREVVPTRDVPNAAAMGLQNGYVIYERYYVDPTHPLLKGLPLPDLPRMSDGPAGAKTQRPEVKRDNFDVYRDRSPVHNGRRNDMDREYRDNLNDYRR